MTELRKPNQAKPRTPVPAQPPTVARKTLTVPEFAAAAGISVQSAYLHLREGRVPSVKLGRRYLIPADAVDRLFAGAAPGMPKPAA